MSGKFWDKGIKLVSGCTKVSEGCANCWAERKQEARFHSNPCYEGLTTDGRFNGKVRFNLHLLERAARKKKPQVYAIWNDLYHPGVTDEQIRDALQIMYNLYVPYHGSLHTYLIVTKRPERAAAFFEKYRLAEGVANHINHIWHIVTVENQQRAEERIPHLLQIPGKRGIIHEPSLGPLDLNLCDLRGLPGNGFFEPNRCVHRDGYRCASKEHPIGCTHHILNKIHQVIAGGETGHGARPAHPDNFRALWDQCEAAEVPFYLKFVNKKTGRLLDGREHIAWDPKPERK